MKNHSILILLLLFFASCANDDDANPSNQTAIDDINLVTGVDIRQDAFSEVIRLGNPNNFQDQTLVFPNPTNAVINLKNTQGQAMEAAWIVRGTKEMIYQNRDFSEIFNSDTYSTQTIENNATLQFPSGLSDEVSIDLENLEDGYYRVFIKVNNTLEWHNFYKGAVDITNFINSWN